MISLKPRRRLARLLLLGCLPIALLAQSLPATAWEWSGKRIEAAKGLTSPDPGERIASLQSLALFPLDDVRSHIVKSLDDPSPRVQVVAVEVLVELNASGRPTDSTSSSWIPTRRYEQPPSRPWERWGKSVPSIPSPAPWATLLPRCAELVW